MATATLIGRRTELDAIEQIIAGARAVGSLLRTFIRTTEDQTVPLPRQDGMIAEADALTPGNRFDVRSLPSSHSPFASMPDRPAAELASL
jgi:hypothetical protein